MRIVIDLQGAQSHGSRDRGIGRYSRSLTRSIIENAGDHEVLLALNGGFSDTIDAIKKELADIVPPESFHVWRPCPSTSSGNLENKVRGEAAKFYREAFLASLNPDVVHVTSLFEGLTDDAVTSVGRMPRRYLTSVTLYDLIPHIHREIYLSNSTTTAWYDQKLEDLRNADLLLGISQSSSMEAVDCLGFDPARVVAVGTAADPQFRVRDVSPNRRRQLAKSYGLKRPFVMYTGGIDHRKNVDRMIHAFGELPARLRREHQLAIVCSVHDDEKNRLLSMAQSIGLSRDSVVLTGFVPEEDLIDLYNICHLFVFPSWHEGFGLPALEAMSCGAPTIASNKSSLPEVIGMDDALFDPFDTASIAELMKDVLDDEQRREALIAHAKVQSARFSWAEIGRIAVESFEKGMTQLVPAAAKGPRRPRLAFCSPLPPSKSGIADVSAEVLPSLCKRYQVDAVVHDNELPQAIALFPDETGARVIGHSQFLDEATTYDRVIYNFGNSNFHLWMFAAIRDIPGVVILHDFFLSAAVRHKNFLNGDMNGWAQELFDDYGPTPLFRYAQPGQPETVLRDYPCNLSILENALGVIVHSNHAKELATEWFDQFEVERWQRAHLPRQLAKLVSKAASRQRLGIKKNEFVVSSFGMLNAFKHNDTLIRAFARSRLAGQRNARLLFVGGTSPDNEGELMKLASTLGVRQQVSITGWTTPQDYAAFLSSVDVAVQLRKDSRGETSAAVLDCLNHGLPTIANANGSMAELPRDAIVLLDDLFNEEDLADELNRMLEDRKFAKALGRRGRLYVEASHAPAVVAEEYRTCVEGIYKNHKAAIQSDLGSLSKLDPEDAIRVARHISELFNMAKFGTIFLDVSVLVTIDGKTGIQRVVRNILSWLVKDAGPHCRIEPIYFDPKSARFFRAAVFSARFFNTSFDVALDPIAHFQPGDIYVALDLAHHHAVQAQAVLAAERLRGVTLCYVLYDLLPIHYPELFPDGVRDLHSRWLSVISEADRVICISRAMADELITELQKRQRRAGGKLEVSWFHLGADIEELYDEELYDEERSDQTVEKVLGLEERPTFLAVGTIEPRKGYQDILRAFEKLWAADVDCRLVIAGAAGWKMEDLLGRLRQHPELGKRLFWFERPSDKTLKQLYDASDCLIAASIGEGFGLPIVEAALHKTPVIARDVPVFREVAPTGTRFFGGAKGADLSATLRQWLADPPEATGGWPAEVLDWRASAAQFLQAARGERIYKTVFEDDSIQELSALRNQSQSQLEPST